MENALILNGKKILLSEVQARQLKEAVLPQVKKEVVSYKDIFNSITPSPKFYLECCDDYVDIANDRADQYDVMWAEKEEFLQHIQAKLQLINVAYYLQKDIVKPEKELAFIFIVNKEGLLKCLPNGVSKTMISFASEALAYEALSILGEKTIRAAVTVPDIFKNK